MKKQLISDFLDKNRKKAINIHCVGDAMVDEYYDVRVARISPEFPMPIMASSNDRAIKRPGGVANVVHQFRHFNVAKTLICLPDRRAERVFASHGFSSHSPFIDIHAKLPIKRRFLDGGIQVVRHDIEIPMCGLKEESINFYHELLEQHVHKTGMNPDVVILSDYDKGFFSTDAFNAARLYPKAKTIVDPKNGPLSKWKGCTIFKPNSKEAEILTGKKNWKEQAKHIQEELGCEAVVITFGGEKVVGVWKDDFFTYHPDKKVEVESVVGAGDCFVAFFAMAIGHDFSVPDAAEIAWNAGSVYVQKKMNRPIVPAELSPDGIVHPADLAKRDFKLALANGCFDVAHSGHMEMLKFAKGSADKLVVALNSDESIRRLKGASRPVLPLEQRMAVMSNIKCVDFVVSFDQDTPYQVIKTIQPDVLVKGAEYDAKDIIGADLVPTVLRAPMIKDFSTTKFLKNQEQLHVEH